MMIRKSLATSMALTMLLLFAAAWPARAGTEDDVKALFGKFIAAQNAHDLKAVGEILTIRLSSCGSRQHRDLGP